METPNLDAVLAACVHYEVHHAPSVVYLDGTVAPAVTHEISVETAEIAGAAAELSALKAGCERLRAKAALADELQRIYDMETNVEVYCFWDGGWTVQIGDATNGYRESFDSYDLVKIADWLARYDATTKEAERAE